VDFLAMGFCEMLKDCFQRFFFNFFFGIFEGEHWRKMEDPAGESVTIAGYLIQ
jgi:hypothetical protein